jgi:hypothetical protein
MSILVVTSCGNKSGGLYPASTLCLQLLWSSLLHRRPSVGCNAPSSPQSPLQPSVVRWKLTASLGFLLLFFQAAF